MTLAITLTILASFLWGITNHIDKFMINGIDENGNNVKTLLVFSTFVAGIVLTPIWLILSKFNLAISTLSLISVLSASVVYILATYFYFKALSENDASIVVVMFQLIPVFSYILALILFKENLNLQQIIGSLIIIASAVIISFDELPHAEKHVIIIIVVKIKDIIFFILLSFQQCHNFSSGSCIFFCDSS